MKSAFVAQQQKPIIIFAFISYTIVDVEGKIDDFILSLFGYTFLLLCKSIVIVLWKKKDFYRYCVLKLSASFI